MIARRVSVLVRYLRIGRGATVGYLIWRTASPLARVDEDCATLGFSSFPRDLVFLFFVVTRAIDILRARVATIYVNYTYLAEKLSPRVHWRHARYQCKVWSASQSILELGRRLNQPNYLVRSNAPSHPSHTIWRRNSVTCICGSL